MEEGSGHQAPSFSCLSRGSKRQQRRSILKPSDRPDLSLFKVQGFMEERKLKWTKTPIHIIAECVYSILSLSLQGSKGVHNLQMFQTAQNIPVGCCQFPRNFVIILPSITGHTSRTSSCDYFLLLSLFSLLLLLLLYFFYFFLFVCLDIGS